MISKYYRIYHRYHWEPRGLVMVDTLPDGKIAFGWSLCDNEDHFSKKTARQIATDRLDSGVIVSATTSQSDIADTISKMPHSLHKEAIKAYLFETRRAIKNKIVVKPQ